MHTSGAAQCFSQGTARAMCNGSTDKLTSVCRERSSGPQEPPADPQPGDPVAQNPDGPNHWGLVGNYAGNGTMYSALNPAVRTLVHPVAWNAGTAYLAYLPRGASKCVGQ